MKEKKFDINSLAGETIFRIKQHIDSYITIEFVSGVEITINAYPGDSCGDNECCFCDTTPTLVVE